MNILQGSASHCWTQTSIDFDIDFDFLHFRRIQQAFFDLFSLTAHFPYLHCLFHFYHFLIRNKASNPCSCKRNQKCRNWNLIISHCRRLTFSFWCVAHWRWFSCWCDLTYLLLFASWCFWKPDHCSIRIQH